MLERLIQFWLQQRGAVELAPVLAVLTVLAATNALATISAYDPMNYSGGSGSINNNTAVTATGTAGLTTAGGIFRQLDGRGRNCQAALLRWPIRMAAFWRLPTTRFMRAIMGLAGRLRVSQTPLLQWNKMDKLFI